MNGGKVGMEGEISIFPLFQSLLFFSAYDMVVPSLQVLGIIAVDVILYNSKYHLHICMLRANTTITQRPLLNSSLSIAPTVTAVEDESGRERVAPDSSKSNE